MLMPEPSGRLINIASLTSMLETHPSPERAADPSYQEAFVAQVIVPLAGGICKNAEIASHLFEDAIDYVIIEGLVALGRYDCSRDMPARTYVSTRMHGAIIDYKRSNGTMPRQQHNAIDGYADLASTHNGELTLEEVASRLGMEPDALERRLAMSGTSMTYDVSNEYGGRLEELEVTGDDHDFQDPLDTAIQEIEASRVRAMLAQLPEREGLVLQRYFFEDMTLKEIASTLDVSESRVCHLKKQALIRLGDLMGDALSDAAGPVSAHTNGNGLCTAEPIRSHAYPASRMPRLPVRCLSVDAPLTYIIAHVPDGFLREHFVAPVAYGLAEAVGYPELAEDITQVTAAMMDQYSPCLHGTLPSYVQSRARQVLPAIVPEGGFLLEPLQTDEREFSPASMDALFRMSLARLSCAYAMNSMEGLSPYASMVRALMEAATPTQRLALILTDCMGMDTSEASTIMGCRQAVTEKSVLQAYGRMNEVFRVKRVS